MTKDPCVYILVSKEINYSWPYVWMSENIVKVDNKPKVKFF